MNICYIGPFRLPYNDAASQRVINNARALRSMGHNVSFVSWGGTPNGSPDSYGWYSFDNFKYYLSGELDFEGSFASRLYKLSQRGVISLNILDSIKTKIDLIISYNPSFSFNLRLFNYCKNKGIFYANDITEWNSNQELKFYEILPNIINMRFLTKKVRNLILISSYLQQYYSKHNVILVPPLCNLDDKKWQNKTSVHDGSKLTFIYAGTPFGKDSLDVIVKSVAKLINRGYSLKLMVLGVSKSQYLDKYEKGSGSIHLPDEVEFLGRVSQNSVPDYLNQSDYMILVRTPSRKSQAGFPTKYAEAISAGLPTVANLTSDIGNYLHHGINGFVIDGYSEEAVSKAIQSVVSLPIETHDKIAENAYNTRDTLDYRRFIPYFEKFIRDLI